ncbi:hypothetical protein METBIDRAFT_199838 [Metschnikowia bicuspidata var. bicuspidata NRRL YB-4993]|uniref:Uncharacterized protein n=1 Tax=Metschnikowia bicuspidata var. bicuspidata NRRL YB-4993 TaxID=869754 RepID=A0A1A0H8P0_9ASCO|nr:hypothetical protein METBIDRAFT_199838 [Metschnikowia bicuspidata var. bicuspidata NRRL YB-4993]OBA20484.1 hypothetical protein METBIDRAFT_199838 [Metschnikowia bicuspidata var. bicuspidata NRRL YB-4993]
MSRLSNILVQGNFCALERVLYCSELRASSPRRSQDIAHSLYAYGLGEGIKQLPTMNIWMHGLHTPHGCWLSIRWAWNLFSQFWHIFFGRPSVRARGCSRRPLPQSARIEATRRGLGRAPGLRRPEADFIVRVHGNLNDAQLIKHYIKEFLIPNCGAMLNDEKIAITNIKAKK